MREPHTALFVAPTGVGNRTNNPKLNLTPENITQIIEKT